MTKRQFVVLVFRLFALYLAFNVITNIGYIFAILRDPFTSILSRVAAVGFDISVALLLIWILWRKSEWLMEKVFAIPVLDDPGLMTATAAMEEDSNEQKPAVNDEGSYYETPISIEGIQIVAISLMGLWASFSRLPNLARGLGVSLGAPVGPTFTWYGIAPWLPDAIVVALGIWLFLRPWQLQEWIERFRPKVADSEDGAG